MSLVVHTYSLTHYKADMFISCSTLAPAAYEETVLVCKSCYDYLMNKVDDMKTDIWWPDQGAAWFFLDTPIEVALWKIKFKILKWNVTGWFIPCEKELSRSDIYHLAKWGSSSAVSSPEYDTPLIFCFIACCGLDFDFWFTDSGIVRFCSSLIRNLILPFNTYYSLVVLCFDCRVLLPFVIPSAVRTGCFVFLFSWFSKRLIVWV